MPIQVVMPQLGESIVEGTIVKWLFKEGAVVLQDQPLVEVSTDKVEVEIPSPSSGVLLKIVVSEGETIPVGTLLAVIQEDATAGAGCAMPLPSLLSTQDTPTPDSFPKERHLALSPVVRKFAEMYNIDLKNVTGTGNSGRITKQDILRSVAVVASGGRVERALKTTETAPPILPIDIVPPADDAHPVGIAAPVDDAPLRREEPVESFYKVLDYQPQEGDEVIPFSRIRAITAEHMVYSKHTAPHVTTVTEVDLAHVVRLREENKGKIFEKTGFDLTFLPFILYATVQAIKNYPQLNGSVVGKSLVIKKQINIGLAVETDRGLIVPVIHGADTKSLMGLSRAASEMAKHAREGRLTPDEVRFGTFTVTNPGKQGNLFGTPILFQPQVGILRMGEITKRPVVIELAGSDAIVIHPMIYLSLSYDHRVIDGATANLFLHCIKEVLETGAICCE